MVLQTGIEPVRHLWHQILSLGRLPIPPLKHMMANYRIAKRWYSRRDSNPQNTHPECVVFANFTTRAYMAVFMLPLVSKVGFEPTEKLVP